MIDETDLEIYKGEVEFMLGVGNISQLQDHKLPEIAFVGKSNVGKSSLINFIFSRRRLAKVSNTPGRTQQLNFFSVANKFIIVDLPGYGYAKVPDNIKNKWENLIIRYFVQSRNLHLVNLLIDARRGIKRQDLEIIELLIFYKKSFQIVLTKTDKIKNLDNLTKNTKDLLATLDLSCNVISTSSRSKYGARELQVSMAEYLRS